MSTSNQTLQPNPPGPAALLTPLAAPMPPSTIRIKRAREDTPVTALFVNPTTTVASTSSKRPKLSTPGTPTIPGPSYIFRLAHTQPFQPQIPVVVDGSQAAGKKRSGAEVGEEGDTPQVSGDKRRKIAPVRQYRLSTKRGRARGRAHPYGGPVGSRGAVFVRVRDRDGDERIVGTVEETKVELQPEVEKNERKRPRTHPKEKERLREEREKAVVGGYVEGGDVLSKEMEKLILEYLDPANNEGIRNLRPATAPPVNDRVGGGVGGGTWEEDKDVNMSEDDEEGYVYDVYIREEVPAGAMAMETTEDYGVIVFAESEDEAWWYEGAEEEDDRSDVYGSDDEDSNAEDYHTNDYPDEPVIAEDEEGEYSGHDVSDEGEDDYENENGGSASRWRPSHPRKTIPGEEEYDLDDSEEDEGPTLRKMVRGVWSLD